MRASAPAGSDSNWSVVVGGPKPGTEKLGMLGMPRPEHPARLKPQAAMATVRFIVASVYLLRPGAVPVARQGAWNADKILLKCALTRVKGQLIPLLGGNKVQIAEFRRFSPSEPPGRTPPPPARRSG